MFDLHVFARESILNNLFPNYGSDTALMLIRQGGIALLQTVWIKDTAKDTAIFRQKKEPETA